MYDDYGVSTDFEALFCFLHQYFFPRLSWARLTLKLSKTKFFSISINILGHEIQGRVGLRPSLDKVAKIRDYPVPENEKELDQFLYMTLYLKRYIPGRAEHANGMKSAVIWSQPIQQGKDQEGEMKTKRKVRKGERAGWNWTEKQQALMDYIKQSIVENACCGGDEKIQYHLACDASQTGLGAVLFQLPLEPPGTILNTKNRGYLKIVMFISQ